MPCECAYVAQERATAKPHVPPSRLLHDQTEQPYLELTQPAILQPMGTFVPNSQTLYVRFQSYQD